MNVTECIRSRRSIRKYSSKPIEHSIIDSIVADVSYSPSWKNTQISRYLVIEDPEALHTICEQYASFNARIIGGCKALIAQTFVKDRSGFERDGSFSTDRAGGWQYYDCGIAAQTLCLAAHEAGLGTVIMGIFDRKGLEEYLQLPENQELMALIAIGHPAEEPAGPKRKDVETLLSYR